MKKILIQYNFILHYRKAFFNELAKYYDVTVLHSGNQSIESSDKYKEIIVPVKKIGPFYFQSNVIKEVQSEKYDITIALFDVRWVNTVLSIYFNKTSKFIWWGAWITKSKIANWIRVYFTKKSDANIFYTYEAKKDFIDANVSKHNLYVANNTFDVGDRIKSFENDVKNSILFVGSLDERKQNDVTIHAFNKILKYIPSEINLTIIGDGEQKNDLINLVNKLKIQNRVLFEGKVTDTNLLQKYYQKAIVSVSFGQAGLSVLQALGFGVPFLTKVNAISGGEKSNIKNNYNGIFCKDIQKSLEHELMRLCNDINLSRKLGQNAYNYYSEYCTIENMTQGFLDAINETRNANIDKNNG